MKARISDIPKIIKKSTQEGGYGGVGRLLTVNQLEVKRPAPTLLKILFKALGYLRS